MKLNKAEIKAIADMRKILDALENGHYLELKYSESMNIQRVFGFDLYKSTLRKKDIKKLTKGKENFFLYFLSPMMGKEGRYGYYGWFPFQVKERKNQI
jgi:hypothetical protein